MNFLTFAFANSKILAGISLFFAFLFSCDPAPKKHTSAANNEIAQNQAFALAQPENDFVTNLNKGIAFEIKPLQNNERPDSVEIYLEGKKAFTSRGKELSFNIRKDRTAKYPCQNFL
jgi:hypothetical protein